MSRVTVAASEDLVCIAQAAGGNPREMIYHEDTGELEVPNVQQANLDTALTQVLAGTVPATPQTMTKKIEDLAIEARSSIEGGFSSLAGGLHSTAKWYDSEIEDQLNLVGNVEAGDDTIHAHRSSQGAQDKVYTNHTNAQLRTVLRDGRDRKLAVLQEFATKKALALAATTKGELDAIQWTMT